MKHKGSLGTGRKQFGRYSPGNSFRYTKSELARNFVKAMSGLGQMQVTLKKVALEDLDKLWRPFLVSTRALGLFPFASLNCHRGVCWWKNPWNFYTIICLCSFIFNLSGIIKQKAVSGLSISVVDINDYSQSAFFLHVIGATSSIIYFLNFKTYLNDLFQVWSSMRFQQVTATKLNVLVGRKIKIALWVCTLDVFCAAVVYGLGFHELSQNNFNVLTLVLGAISFWCEIGDTFQIGLFCALCCSTSCLLKGICYDLETDIADGSVGVNLKVYKNMYMTVVCFIDVANQFFGIYVGFLIITTTFEACCNTYSFSSYGYDHHFFVPMLYWLLESWCVMVVVCLSAGEVCDQAGRLYKIMLEMDAFESSPCRQNQVLMVLDCFRNLDAKIAMFGIIPITKQTLPTIISVYLSYIFLLYQFPRGSDKVPNSPEQP